MSQAPWALTAELYNPLAGKPVANAGNGLAATPAYDRVLSELRNRALAQFSAVELANAQAATLSWLSQCAHDLALAENDQALSAGGTPAFAQPTDLVVEALLN